MAASKADAPRRQLAGIPGDSLIDISQMDKAHLRLGRDTALPTLKASVFCPWAGESTVLTPATGVRDVSERRPN